MSSRYPADFSAFKTALVPYLVQTHSTHRTAFDLLASLRSQLVEKAQCMPAWCRADWHKSPLPFAPTTTPYLPAAGFIAPRAIHTRSFGFPLSVNN
jgi:hypothetical protein